MRQSLPHGLPEGAPQTDSDKQELCRAQAPRPENPAYGRYHYLPHFTPGLHFRPHGETTLERNDVLTVVGTPENLTKYGDKIGHRSQDMNQTDLLSLGFGLSWASFLAWSTSASATARESPWVLREAPHRRPAARPLRTAGPHRRLHPAPHPPSFAGPGAGLLPG